MYDQTGRPILWSPISKYNEVNITYSHSGLVTYIQRGTWTEKMEYDPSGNIVSRTWADGKIWSYTYLEKVNYFKSGVCAKAKKKKNGLLNCIYLFYYIYLLYFQLCYNAASCKSI